MKLSRILGAVAVMLISGASFIGGYLAGDTEARKELHAEHMRDIDTIMAIFQRDKSPSPSSLSPASNIRTDDSGSQ